jgi:hypothetical protein
MEEFYRTRGILRLLSERTLSTRFIESARTLVKR